MNKNKNLDIAEIQNLIENFETQAAELHRAASLAYFDASISGSSEDYQKAGALQLEMSKLYADRTLFAQIKKALEEETISDPILKRQIEVLYNSSAGYQFSEKLLREIVEESTKIEAKFATFRAKVDGEFVTDNEIEKALSDSTDQTKLEKYWTAGKQVGEEVADEVISLVKKRNRAAAELGYRNYREMSFLLSEQNPDELDKMFDELDRLTAPAYEKAKAEIDLYLSRKHRIQPSKLMPWLYQDRFNQHAPKIYNVDLDRYFKGKDIENITSEFFSGIGLPIEDMLQQSDLYEKDGKYQHAYCTDIDKCGDVRVLCNIKDNQSWMGTMLHEFGHAVYDKFVSPKLPWLLREHAHIFTTEAIAMFFGRLAFSPHWLRDFAGIDEKENTSISAACFKSQILEQLVFCRWEQVMYRFEKELYENPDQDLNSLWWRIVEKYQGLRKPEIRRAADWASKIHLALYPAYYHNYMLGEILASQLYYYITEKVLGGRMSEDFSFANISEAGEYLRHLFFSYGALYPWNELIVKATGEELKIDYYVRQFIQ